MIYIKPSRIDNKIFDGIGIGSYIFRQYFSDALVLNELVIYENREPNDWCDVYIDTNELRKICKKKDCLTKHRRCLYFFNHIIIL